MPARGEEHGRRCAPYWTSREGATVLTAGLACLLVFTVHFTAWYTHTQTCQVTQIIRHNYSLQLNEACQSQLYSTRRHQGQSEQGN